MLTTIIIAIAVIWGGSFAAIVVLMTGNAILKRVKLRGRSRIN